MDESHFEVSVNPKRLYPANMALVGALPVITFTTGGRGEGNRPICSGVKTGAPTKETRPSALDFFCGNSANLAAGNGLMPG